MSASNLSESGSSSTGLERRELRRVLLVEDEPDIEVVVRLSLEAIGHLELLWCDSGVRATEVAAREQPDLILLDAMLPDCDGLQVLRSLRALAATAAIPVVFLTARAQPAEIEEYRRAGATEIITKPFDPMTLPHRLQQAYLGRGPGIGGRGLGVGGRKA